MAIGGSGDDCNTGFIRRNYPAYGVGTLYYIMETTYRNFATIERSRLANRI